MKPRRQPLKRTPLGRGKPLERKTPLRRTGFRSSGENLNLKPRGSSNGPVKARSESAHIPRPIRLAVLDRDEDCCQRCGRSVLSIRYSLHHRRPRKLGGSRHLHTMANLVTLCGTGTTGCHGEVEADRPTSRAFGWLVPNGVTPEQWPVFRHGSWQQPGDIWTACEPHPRQTEMLRELGRAA